MNAPHTSAFRPARTSAVSSLRQLSRSYMAVPSAIFVVVLAANLALGTEFVSPGRIATTLALMSPYVLVAMAQALPTLGGGGGVDMSVGPVLGFTTVLVAAVLAPRGLGSPWVVIPVVLVYGALVGALNGGLIAYVRLPAIVATFGTYLIFQGLAPAVMPVPGAPVPSWLRAMVGSFGPVPGVLVVFLLIAVAWAALRRSAYVRNMLSVGGDERAALTAGINVRRIRLVAYTMTGVLSAIGGLLLAGTIQSGDATVGAIFTITSLAGMALGGVSLFGGRGGLLGAAIGGATYYLIQSLLTSANVSVHQMKAASGVVLILALGLNGTIDVVRRRRARRGSNGAAPNTRPTAPGTAQVAAH